jgi:hypothetical protein
MLTPKFKPLKDQCLHLTPDYICDSHWLLTKRIVFKMPKGMVPKIILDLEHRQNGRYPKGIKGYRDDNTMELASVIPKRDGYQKLLPQPTGVEFRSEWNISAYKFQNEETIGAPTFTIGVSTDYVSLMRLGFCFAKDAVSPILILADNDLNSPEFIGLVMPMRLGK